MRIAILNSWPNIPKCAEAEWIRRALIACRNLKFEAKEVITSDDINEYKPDCVLVTHEYSTKLTGYPTIGLMWSPVSFYGDDPVRRQAVLSYDGHLCGSPAVAQWVEDFLAGNGKQPCVHHSLMLPSASDCGPAVPLPLDLAVMYAGVNWDGTRHGAIFRGLDGKVPLRFYGPSGAWSDRGADYHGELPFDGISVIEALRAAGIALCLHKAAHRTYNCPSMRLFEAAAAGALIITDNFDFPREWFRDNALYIDADLPAPMVVKQIIRHVTWAQRNREAANRLAKGANALFRRSLTLESMLRTLPEFVEKLCVVRHMTAPSPAPSIASASRPAAPVVEYIVRVGTHAADTIARALDSLASQTHSRIGVILVQQGAVDGIEGVVEAYRSRFVSFRHLVVPENGYRSTALWAGLNAVTAAYFGLLDESDSLFPNHVATVIALLEAHPATGVAYAGAVTVEDEPGRYFEPFQFTGPAGKRIPERRSLSHFEEQDFSAFGNGHLGIAANAWIARRVLLDPATLRDPKLETDDTRYLLTLLAGRTRPRFTALVTAAHHHIPPDWENPDSEAHTAAADLRWRNLVATLDMPARNRAPPLGIVYDAQKEVYGDAT